MTQIILWAVVAMVVIIAMIKSLKNRKDQIFSIIIAIIGLPAVVFLAEGWLWTIVGWIVYFAFLSVCSGEQKGYPLMIGAFLVSQLILINLGWVVVSLGLSLLAGYFFYTGGGDPTDTW